MQTADSNLFIDYRGVNVSYNHVDVLRNVDFKLDKGEIVYLIGRVGCGKSTLLKSFYAEARISEGKARVLNFDLNKINGKQVPFLRRKLGIVFQDFKLLTDRSVNDNLEFVLRATDMKDSASINRRIKEVLDFVGMSAKGYKMPHELSGGEQQRVVIARALLNNPQIILADEPTGNLDAHTGKEIMQLIYQVVESGTSVVMATHNMRWISMFPGRVFHCVEGKLTEIPSSQLENFTLDDFYNL
ncbi:MAG: ATP-binding cassette domain-containing protein [Paludibacteraceae bacterium]|nr:ATP-binding cassette domain-containing protein [Paludibacteraceae bacterium]